MDDLDLRRTFEPIMREQIAESRRIIRRGYLGMAAAVIAGALLTWSAIHEWLTGHPTWSAVFTALAFANFGSFSMCIQARRDMLSVIEKWKEAERGWR